MMRGRLPDASLGLSTAFAIRSGVSQVKKYFAVDGAASRAAGALGRRRRREIKL